MEKNTKQAICIVILSLILMFSYLHWFSRIGEWGYIIQVIGFAYTIGNILFPVSYALVHRMSPVAQYWLRGKTAKYLLLLLLASEFVMIFGIGLPIGLRTIYLWIFIPVYSVLSQMRSIPSNEVLTEKYKYMPEGKI